MSGDDDGGEGLQFLRKLGVPQGMDQLALTFGIAGIALVGLAAYKGGEWIRILRGGMSDEAHIVEFWDGEPPLIADINADGQEEIVGTYAGKGGIYLGAFDGKTGEIRWRYGPINISRAANGGLIQFGRQGDLLLVNEKTKGKIVSLKDGREVAQVALPSAREVCASKEPGGPLPVATSSALKFLEVDLASRKVVESAGRRPCDRPMANSRIIDKYTTPQAPASSRWALRSGEYMLVHSYDKAQAEESLELRPIGGGTPLWKVTPFPKNPKKHPTAGNVRLADIAGGRVYVSHFVFKTPLEQRVLCLDLKTGEEKWRVPIDSPGSMLKNLTATESRVYVALGDYLVVLDADTGKVVLDLGQGRE